MRRPRLLVSISCLALLLASNFLAAENRGLLWEVSRKGEANPEAVTSYLMGSIHFGKDSFYPLSKNTLDAYAASSILYIEVDEEQITPQALQALFLKYALYPEGESLRDHVSAETLGLLENLLAEFGVPLTAIENQKPMFISVMLAALQAQKLGYRPEKGIDKYFQKKATSQKTIRQIETFEDQMKLLAQLPIDDASLKDEFADMADYATMWDTMVKAWKTGDGDAMYQEVIAKPLKEYPRLKPLFEQLFFSRNIKMAQTAESCIQQKKRCFIVVGAGHLVGSRSVVDVLRNKGYSVKQK